jgi:hypothetical protein
MKQSGEGEELTGGIVLKKGRSVQKEESTLEYNRWLSCGYRLVSIPIKTIPVEIKYLSVGTHHAWICNQSQATLKTEARLFSMNSLAVD